MMSISEYQPPVSELLNYGDCRNHNEWVNYVQDLGLEHKHIPELIKMVKDPELNQADSESKEVWSPLHAWRALGQLKALEAFEPLVELLNEGDDEWLNEDFPIICTLIGLDTVPLLKELLSDTSKSVYARIDAASSLESISHKYPATRDSVVEAIAGELKKFEHNDSIFNALLISKLVDLQAVETINLIEQAFKTNRVENFICGDFEDIQVDFGLKSPDEVQKSRFSEIASLFSSSNKNKKVFKGFGFNKLELDAKKRKSRKSSKKKKKR